MKDRLDFVKRFELITKQEIKNYNDTILNTHLAINNLNLKINEIEGRAEKAIAQVKKVFIENDIRLEKYQSQVLEDFSALRSRISSLETEIKFHKLSILSFKEAFTSLNYENSKFDNHIQVIYSSLSSNVKAISELRNEFLDHASSIKESIRFQINELREEFIKKPSEFSELKVELEKKIASNTINYEGIIKELLVCKKSAMINDKKIENLYTLIERHEKRLNECLKPD